MNKSDTIGKLAEALSKAQSVIKGAITDSENPFFKSKYADLASVWDACRKPLTDNGLAVVQTSIYLPEHPDMVAIETTLTHSSGEYISGIMVGKPVKSDPQSLGSCVTYLRRYSLAAMVGVSPEDDDGNAASKEKLEPTPKQETPKKPDVTPDTTKISAAQRSRFFAIPKETGYSEKEIKDHILSLGYEHTADILKSQYDDLCKWAMAGELR